MRTSIGKGFKAALFTAPLIFMCASLAEATTFNLVSPLDQTGYINSQTLAPGALDDKYFFTIAPGDVNATFSAFTLTLPNPGSSGNFYNISTFAGTLFDNNAPVASLSFNGSQYALNGTFGTGPSHAYELELTGTVDGKAGGFYAFSMAAAPVPEPSTAMAAIAGLALLGFAVRRRRETEF